MTIRLDQWFERWLRRGFDSLTNTCWWKKHDICVGSGWMFNVLNAFLRFTVLICVACHLFIVSPLVVPGFYGPG